MNRLPFDERAHAIIQHMRGEARVRQIYVDQLPITRGEVARRFGLSATHCGRILDRMCAEGIMVRDHVYPSSKDNMGVVRYWLSESACDALFSQEEISWSEV